MGTFTPEGTYRAAEEKLVHLRDLGATMIELMPVAAFDGARGWGYDGVSHFAPFAPYGTPDELCAFIDHAHALGMRVILDVVYNHFGPSGNYLSCYSEAYFTSKYQNAWGDAPDFTSPIMRRHVLDNVRYWLSQFRFDGLRLDATPTLFDPSPKHILREIADLAPAIGPGKVIIAEDDRNDPAVMTDLGMSAVWADDFHHQIHVTLTGERDGYYRGFEPGAAGVARTINEGWLFTGQHYAPRDEDRGKPANGVRADQLVYCLQNHDQVGNRALGERLSALVPQEAYAAVSMLLLFLPMTPLLFMGQEWACRDPFLYFTDHDPDLGQKIREGRRNEFRAFTAFSDPAARDEIPDPQAMETFTRSRLDWDAIEDRDHRMMLSLYRNLLLLRRSDPILQHASRDGLHAEAEGPVLRVERRIEGESRVLLVNLSANAAPCGALLPDPKAVELMLANRPGAWVSSKLGPYEAWLLATRATE
ncbi:MAG: alpha-amylase family glycosyl hydrolase [Minicystis sp.]